MIGVLVSGSGTNLQALIDDGLPICAVASNVGGVPALERAARAGIPTDVFPLEAFETREERDRHMAEWLAGLGADLVVCAGYMHILTAAFLDRFPHCVINVHPSLLPAFPGRRPVEDALRRGVRVTGVTVHLVDAGVDTGPILLQEAVPVVYDDTADLVRERVHAVEHRLLPHAVALLAADRVEVVGRGTRIRPVGGE